MRGFSVVEVVVAMALTLALTAVAFSTVSPGYGQLEAQDEAADVEQRLRVASNTLFDDLAMAGAGIDAGSQSGPLLGYFAPVLPFRQAATRDDAPGTVRSDTITVIYVPVTSRQTTITTPLLGATSVLTVADDPVCDGAPLCGFTTGATALVFDAAGDYDIATVTAAQGDAGQIHIERPHETAGYGVGAKIAEAVRRIYFLKTDDASHSYQLMRSDGSGPDVPVLDHVVSLTFEYFGEPRPPELLQPSDSELDPRTTYGPAPPAPDADMPGHGYPAGENCVFAVDSITHQQVPRLAELGAGSPMLVRLSPDVLNDGPWCPDAGNPNRWDADLLRIRSIVVHVRVQAAVAALRGPAGSLFAHAGTATSATAWVPDREIRFQVSPRNMNGGR